MLKNSQRLNGLAQSQFQNTQQQEQQIASSVHNNSELQDVMNFSMPLNQKFQTPNNKSNNISQQTKSPNIAEVLRENNKTPRRQMTFDQKNAVHKILSPFKKYSEYNFQPLASSRTQRSMTQNGQLKIDISPVKKSDVLSRSQCFINKIDQETFMNINTPVKSHQRLNLTPQQKKQMQQQQYKVMIDNFTKHQNELDMYQRLIDEKTREKILLQKDVHEIKKEINLVKDDIFKLQKSKQNFKDENNKFRKNLEKLNSDKLTIQQEDKNIASDIINLEEQIDDIKLKAKDISDKILLESDVIKDLTERIKQYKKSYQALSKDKDHTRNELLKSCKQMQRLETKLVQYSKMSNNLMACFNFKQLNKK
ncbi:hypothetical protein ABPG74_010003 [Tetrahymena malaccensis]